MLFLQRDCSEDLGSARLCDLAQMCSSEVYTNTQLGKRSQKRAHRAPVELLLVCVFSRSHSLLWNVLL